MELRRELILSIGALVVLNVVLAFGAIGLFVRMGPAIEHLLRENVRSTAAAEEMLVEMAAAGGLPLTDAARARVRAAYQRARDNVTEAEEEPVLRAMARELPAALAGDARARAALVREIHRLSAINRVAMQEGNENAQRLGRAGAWAGVFVGALSFCLSFVVVSRLRRRFLTPLIDLHTVLEGVRRGEQFRRCRKGDVPAEIGQVLASVNMLLDDRLERMQEEVERADAGLERVALVALLERQPEPVVVVDRDGGIACASSAALELLAGDQGAALKASLSGLAQGRKPAHPAVTARPLRDGAGWLCALAAASGAAS